MVRLERLINEKLLNTRLLKRQRVISSPQKWYPNNIYDHLRLTYFNIIENTVRGKLLKPLLKMFCYAEIKYQLDIFQQQGLTPEDRLLHPDSHLRRNVLWEHIARESFHPYHWVLKIRRRERFYRIDYAAPGFFVPDYIKSEAATQTYYDYIKLEREWAAFFCENYGADMTPEAKGSVVPKLIPLEFIQNFGVMRIDAWDRYFMNETNSNYHTAQEQAIVKDRTRFPYNLTTQEGKKTFEKHIVDLNQKIPGCVAPPGQKFDFKAYYQEIGL